MKKLKICIVSPKAFPLLTNSDELPPGGGAEIQLVTLGKAFADQGHEICFLVDDFGQDPSIDISTRISVKKVPLRYMGGPNYYLPLDWMRLVSILKRVNADVLLVKLPKDLLFPLGMFCRIYKKKLIFIFQTDRDINSARQEKTSRILQHGLFRLGLSLTSHVVCQTETQLNGLRKFHSGEASVIRNILSFDSAVIRSKEDFVLWVGSDKGTKRPDLFLDLAKKCPDLSFKMIMKTWKTTADDPQIRKNGSHLPNLEFLGAVPFHKIGPFFQKASVLVSTSELEGFPNIFLQAWQSETPVVSLKVDPDNIIKKYGLGRVSVSLNSMASDIRGLMKNRPLRERLGCNGKRYVMMHHNPSTIVRQYCSLFDSLFNGSQSRSNALCRWLS